MDWVIPTIPPVLLIVLNFLSPYIVSVLTSASWSASTKRTVALVTSFVVSAAVVALSLWVGWLPADTSPIGIVTISAIGLLMQQVAYKNFLPASADYVQKHVGVGSHQSE